jgi:hypothetical protein
LTNFKVGELEPVSNLLNNLELTDSEKDELFGKVNHCHALMLVLESVEDYDSYMISEEDVTNTSDFANSAFRTGYADTRKWNADSYNFFLPVLSTNYMIGADDVIFGADSTSAFDDVDCGDIDEASYNDHIDA